MNNHKFELKHIQLSKETDNHLQNFCQDMYILVLDLVLNTINPKMDNHIETIDI